MSPSAHLGSCPLVSWTFSGSRLLASGCFLVSCLLASWFLLPGCEREIITADPGIPTVGYEVRGIVTDRLGNPLPNVKVRLEYDLLLEDANEPQSRSYLVAGGSELIQIKIFSAAGTLYKSVGPLFAPSGPFEYQWDESGEGGTPAPPGAYYVTYVVSGTEVLSYPVLLQNHVATTTNAVGRYTIPSNLLPVDFYPVPLFSGDNQRFYGNYRVSNILYAYFEPPGTLQSKLQQIQLTRDRVVVHNVTY